MKTSKKTQYIKQSGIRSASIRCAAINGINLGQGVCDLPVEDIIKEAAYSAIDGDNSLYSPANGIFPLRAAIANKLQYFNGIKKVDPETEVIVTHGSTGAFVCAISTVFDSGDEVILFEPFYGYHKNILELEGIKVVTVPIDLIDLSIDMKCLEKSITPKTRGIVICTPCNPCGKVFSTAELKYIANVAIQHGLWIITDEIYEYITYPGFSHVSLASLDESYKDFTITISGFSKTYNMTGWRLGYATGPESVIAKMTLVQDLFYVCPATPLQYAVLAAFQLPKFYYDEMLQTYLHKRERVVSTLTEFGFSVTVPQGAYYLLADFTKLGFPDDETAAQNLLEHAKVATVPGRYFYSDVKNNTSILRFCYALHEVKIEEALTALKNWQRDRN